MTSSIASRNFLRSLQLLFYLKKIGANNFILCPGSRSAPLALAAGELYKKEEIELFNSIDERSAGFHALGLSAASGNISVVITTSGTAVANLLPAAVEADKSSIPVLFITADRPLRLKNCGANQTVQQEDFLEVVCKEVFRTNPLGFHLMNDFDLEKLINSLSKEFSSFAKPYHLNIPFEKPLDISTGNKKKIYDLFSNKDLIISNKKRFSKSISIDRESNFHKRFSKFNLLKSGIIIVGPYFGSPKDLSQYNNALKRIQEITGWPIFADPVSGVAYDLPGLVENWEIIISSQIFSLECDHLLRVGPISTSNHLEKFLMNFKGDQFLVKENDSRNLDPLNKSIQYEYGVEKFLEDLILTRNYQSLPIKNLTPLAKNLIKEGKRISAVLKEFFSINNKVTECYLANFIPDAWPKGYPIMISASSPIRDWLTFSSNKTLTRRCFSFRGASGIDGTLSLALGIARIDSPLLLVTGDLAYLHDINGWLIENSSNLKLTILLIDNMGGNIFNELYKRNLSQQELEKLFTMPKILNWEKLTEAYKIPYRVASNFKKLKDDLEWSLSKQGSVIIRVTIDLEYELNLRNLILNRINNN